ncbi:MULTISPECIES: response regulator transcription factor [unclassified Thalassotalea]|uniref:response regulator transcription factor n=1 Tax=unclassified Thalassotalea TaxID=2614972 RepID=UPI0010803CB4|nr:MULTISPECIES: response regulator transcription factor [unclassified Thalassotalea]NMP16387.1 response regulator transcription factor [Thalassotalea sp. Y01]QBY03238.1 response regulator transcription factor [Thalassotalea sp. HSM 43]
MTDTVLVVEDDDDLAELVTMQLHELAIDVEHQRCGQEGLDRALANDYQLVILDVMLPKLSGLDICRQLRDKKPEQAIMILTSKSSETDRVLGLELGADDFMTKPFSVRELQARVRTQLRRVHLLAGFCQQQAPVESQLQLGDLHINQLTHKTTLAGQRLDLTSTEFDLLLYLASHPDQVFSRSQLLSSVWGYHHSGYEHTVNSHINRLRNKLEKDINNPQIVQTVWGVGYKFNRQGVSA